MNNGKKGYWNINFMFMRKDLKSMIATTVFSICVLFTAHAQEKPNIIWLMAEDIGPDIECYGMKAVKTPNLNQLAEEGTRYTHCFSTNPICSPNRSAMMVGVHQHKINAQHHRGNRDVPLPAPYKPFTYWLRQAGYTTILGNPNVMDSGRKIDCNFKSTPLGAWDGREKFGLFDKYDALTAEDQPFFAQIQLKVTHRGDWWEEIRARSPHPVDPDKVELPSYMADHPVIRLDGATYLDQIEYMDNEVGTLIKDLKKEEEYNTSTETIYHPQPSVAINILEWVMYQFPEDYLRLLRGEHIGYSKYVKSFNAYKSENEGN